MEKGKTHYRKAFNSPYLSSADIVGTATLTVKNVSLDPDKTKRTKDLFNTAYFVEKTIRPGEELKPMILNAHNSRVMKDLVSKVVEDKADAAFIDNWVNIPITIYVDQNVRFGRDTVEGLRISAEQPRAQKPELVIGTDAWTRAIAAYRRDKNFAVVEKHMVVSDEAKEIIKKEVAA